MLILLPLQSRELHVGQIVAAAAAIAAVAAAAVVEHELLHLGQERLQGAADVQQVAGVEVAGIRIRIIFLFFSFVWEI